MRRQDSSTAAPMVLVVAVVVAVVTVLVGSVGAVPVQTPPRHVVVVSDSILLGAQGPLTQRLGSAGWSVTFDGAVSRSTLAGAEAVRAHGAELTDTLVVSLGANDSGNPTTFRKRVDAVMAAAANVPTVHWLTIREVRPYYGPANQVLRDAAARYPNLHIVDWHAASAGRTDLTGGDGLHLTGAGSAVMADVVAAAVTGAPAPSNPVATPAAAEPPAVPAEPPAAPAEPAAGPEVAPSPDGTAPAATTPVADPPSIDRMWFVAGAEAPASGRVGRSPEGPDDGGSGSRPAAGGALLWLLAALAAVALAVRFASRRVRPDAPPSPDATSSPDATPSPDGAAPLTRSQLRAARIAGARGRHPAASTIPPVPDEWAPGVGALEERNWSDPAKVE